VSRSRATDSPMPAEAGKTENKSLHVMFSRTWQWGEERNEMFGALEHGLYCGAEGGGGRRDGKWTPLADPPRVWRRVMHGRRRT
jgi:hypothetical protein